MTLEETLGAAEPIPPSTFTKVALSTGPASLPVDDRNAADCTRSSYGAAGSGSPGHGFMARA